MLAIVNHWIAADWRGSDYLTPIAEIVADRGDHPYFRDPETIRPIVESWESLAALRRALGDALDPWLDVAVERADHERYRCGDETAEIHGAWSTHSPITIYDPAAPVLALPRDASRYVGEKAPHIGGNEDTLAAANVEALRGIYEDRVQLAYRYAFGGEDYACNLGPDEDGSYDTARDILRTIAALEDYPCVNEEVWSDVEDERRAEALDNWLREDLKRKVLRSSCERRAEFDDSREDEIDRIVDEHAWEAMYRCSADDICVDKRAIGALAKALNDAGLLIWEDSHETV